MKLDATNVEFTADGANVTMTLQVGPLQREVSVHRTDAEALRDGLDAAIEGAYADE